ncbi:MAG: hypothetical protein KA369_17195 [Spirochaetes bacterium]|nr:hypothetical protein [Spirochaetota bacterium]
MKAPIRKTIIGFDRRDSARLINELGGEGIIHVGRWDGENAGAVSPPYAGLEESIDAMLSAIENICAEFNVALAYQPGAGTGPGIAPVIFDRDIGSDRNMISGIRDEMDGIRDLRQRYKADHEAAQLLVDAANDIDAIIEEPGKLLRMSLCSHVFGTVQEEIDKSGRELDEGYYIRRAGRHVLGLSMAGDIDGLTGLLKKHGFEDKEEILERYARNPQVLDDLKARSELMRKELGEKEESLDRRAEEIIGTLAGLHEIYAGLKMSMEAKKAFARTVDAEFVSCWIDLDDLERLLSLLERVCGTRFFLHVFTREEMRDVHGAIPVRLRNRWFFRAFEMIVRNAGVPESVELDPTPVAAIVYLLMFGVMFGDVGQGLVLCLAGLVMKAAAKRRDLKPFFRDGGTILVAAGIAAAVFGVLYGSVFSSEQIIPALWFHPMRHIMDLFFAAIMMGALFISMGLVMNMVNLFRDGDYFEAVFGIHGLLGFIVYTGSLFLTVRYVRYDIRPALPEMIVILVIPVGLFLFRNVPARLFFGREALFPNGVFEYAVESFVELMEMFTGFLGNSISFIRAGAFALSHAGLSIAVYTLAAIAGPLFSIASISIIVIGNIFIILLEGLVCGIQSMRLEYYEFFGKFFRGNGVEFKPFSTKRKQVIAKGVA